jgi:hypothetical protein
LYCANGKSSKIAWQRKPDWTDLRTGGFISTMTASDPSKLERPPPSGNSGRSQVQNEKEFKVFLVGPVVSTRMEATRMSHRTATSPQSLETISSDVFYFQSPRPRWKFMEVDGTREMMCRLARKRLGYRHASVCDAIRTMIRVPGNSGKLDSCSRPLESG